MNEPEFTTPDELAAELAITGRRLRAWLRVEFPRPDSEHGTRWYLDEHIVRRARTHFRPS